VLLAHRGCIGNFAEDMCLADPYTCQLDDQLLYNDILKYMQSNFDMTAFSGRKPIGGRFSVRSDSLHRQNMQRSAGFSCQRELYVCFFSRSSMFDYIEIVKLEGLGLTLVCFIHLCVVVVFFSSSFSFFRFQRQRDARSDNSLMFYVNGLLLVVKYLIIRSTSRNEALPGMNV
jgi:hypothetical protein